MIAGAWWTVSTSSIVLGVDAQRIERMPDGSNEIHADVAAKRRQFAVLLAQLRAAEPRFAEASVLLPNEVGEWHAAVYLLTGCGPVWERLGPPIVAQCSLSPVLEEMESARRRWTKDQRAAMEWAMHFWRPDKYAASFPATFQGFLFTRWIVAAHLQKGMVPMIRVVRG